ncbi:lysylphosphatidylglycerol synthase transmembrane domain-containing protein [Sciscionella sediminilitoris]|uniref:lysylphosphatidylglycerol synthase transmembrane domain-containing protein n=1 Tax=Sciscionella sediminilitoris TaxID=1445613 RepID=UPI00068BD543|nr:lysylphosphatidylglycerol synthase transmembrane domain-containing protein [Sciscionella sp. SE31]
MTAKLWSVLQPLLGAGVLFVLVLRLGTDSALHGLAALRPGTLLAALGIGFLTTVCSARRWWHIARAVDIRLPLDTAIADYYRALLLNAVLPVGVLGDVHRGLHHGRLIGDVGKGMRAVALERSAGQITGIVVAVLILLAQPQLLGLLAPYAIYLLAGLALLAALTVILFARRNRVLMRILAEARTAFTGSALRGVLLMSVLTFLGHVLLFLIAARASGATAGVGELLPLVVLGLLAMSLPVNIGGWGPREAVLAIGFGAAGLGAGAGLAAGVAYGVLTLVAALPGALVLLLRRDARIAPYPNPRACTS